MAKKFTADIVLEVLQDRLRDERVVQDILREMQHREARLAAEQEAEKEPPEKKVLHILLPEQPNETAWVLQIPESMPPVLVEEKVRAAVSDFNASPIGRKSPAETIGQGLEVAGAKFFKAHDLRVKTKLPVAALPLTSNAIEGKAGALTREDLRRARSR